MDQSSEILNKFPKKRRALPKAFQEIYNTHYFSNRNGQYATTSLSQKMESWMHRKVASDLLKKNAHMATLEIGAGTLNQLRYEGNISTYDIVEPFTELFQNAPELKKIRNIYKDISDISGNTYDRITAIATFEHIMDLPFVVATAARLLNQGGHLRIAIPNEGTLFWRLGTEITGFEFRKKYGLDYQILMQYEHVNTADDIEKVLEYFFKKTECSVFGVSKKFAFYRFYDCSLPCLERVGKYLKTHTAYSTS